MFRLDTNSVTSWESVGAGAFGPRSIDAPCPNDDCGRNPVNFPFGSKHKWYVHHGLAYLYGTSVCPGCQGQARFWVLDPPNKNDDELIKKARVFLDPTPTSVQRFDKAIEEISPSFVWIFNQAAAAELEGLNELVGIGYRKALEFLVKDFLTNSRPEDTNTIKQTFLKDCISDFVDDPKIKGCALRATWLGNDETHYTRRFPEKDIKDLKLLIDLTVHWVTAHVLTKRFEKDMGNGAT